MKLRRLLIVPGAALLALIATALVSGAGDDPEVRVEPVARRNLIATAIGNGQLRPAKRADVESEAAGRVTAVFVREGSVVRPGDVLAQVERTRSEIIVERARAAVAQGDAGVEQVLANLTQARANLKRAESIAESSGLLATQELEQARTQVRGLEASWQSAVSSAKGMVAQLQDARDGLNRTSIVAPIGGTVVRLRVRAGEMLGNGGPAAAVATIADLSTIEAVVSVGEADLPRVHVGDSAAVRVDAFSRDRLAGHVTHIGPASLTAGSGRQTALYEVIVTLAPTTRVLYPDLSVTAEIVAEQRLGVLGVPLLAVVMRDRDGMRPSSARERRREGDARAPVPVEGVFVLRDGIAQFQRVRTGIVGDQHVEILRGLAAGDRVIVGPYQLLRELEGGTPVTAAAPASPDAPLLAGRR